LNQSSRAQIGALSVKLDPGDGVDRVTVACVQQRMRLHATIDEYREDLQRFLRVAQNKQSQLAIFPELGGVMVVPPLLRDFRSALLKRADRGRRRRATVWQRMTGALAAQTASLLRADFRLSLRALLDVAPEKVWDIYANLFGELAREFGLVLVAPSAYLPDPADQTIRNLAGVFGSDGSLLGCQAKVILHPEDEGLAQTAQKWTPIHTPVGSLGLILGSDVLYPEVGRMHAYQGAEMLVLQAACSTPVLYQKVRSGMLARMQDNQLFAAASFLVGANDISRTSREPFVGKSAIFAPQELTPRFNGVQVEMGNLRSEGVLAAEWDFGALKKLWETSDTPVRKQLPLVQAGQILSRLYERLKSLPRTFDPALLAEVENEQGGGLLSQKSPFVVEPLHLDELPVVGVVTRRWSNQREEQPLAYSQLDISALPENLAHDWQRALAPEPTEAASPAQAADEETDEMDALPGANEPKH
jgi:predicted amidohydrolase